MDEVSKKEMAFWIVAGCAILSFLVAYKVKSWWYLLAGIGFIGLGAYVRHQLLEARATATK